MVHKEGFEPSRGVSPLVFETSVSANFTIRAGTGGESRTHKLCRAIGFKPISFTNFAHPLEMRRELTMGGVSPHSQISLTHKVFVLEDR